MNWWSIIKQKHQVTTHFKNKNILKGDTNGATVIGASGYRQSGCGINANYNEIKHSAYFLCNDNNHQPNKNLGANLVPD
jgi:hypothetical protein